MNCVKAQKSKVKSQESLVISLLVPSPQSPVPNPQSLITIDPSLPAKQGKQGGISERYIKCIVCY
ncbi:hypothetical protein FDUTEX481_05304 [Tolypothrix sp. PCC 7601]|nr:hypothetical protein FDUTEX481_05304 [Tolypothrix sp. PCC 7601]